MTVRFFMMQTHYRSTLDFSNEALQAAEKGFRRLWEAYENLQKFAAHEGTASDAALDSNLQQLLAGMDEHMNDDFNTAKLLANMFEIVPTINSMRDGGIPANAISGATLQKLKDYFKNYLENVLGLRAEVQQDDDRLNSVLQLLVEIRKEARAKKDYATSDTIRNRLTAMGVIMKDEKDGSVTISFT